MSVITLAPFGQLPAVHITAFDGAEAIVTLFGAHLVSWKSADGRQRLFCSERSALDGSRAIRGGVPVIFPQFNERGPGMRHGFARVSDWALVDSGSVEGRAFAVFALEPHDLAAERAAQWPHDFLLHLRVEVGAGTLAMSLEVENRGAAAFSFSSALHTYHLVERVADVRIDGLRDGPLAIGDTLDEIFYGVKGSIALDTGAGTLALEQDGFTDAVVWNPGAANATAMPDLAADEYERFVCIEPAVIEPLTLEAGQKWLGRYRISS
ncbi:MAG: putative glucose-6-phosphate 1-epimerase [Massilia sp.]|nr:putative glucose-6-phosphate 1-epimerase [Massilia sp.]